MFAGRHGYESTVPPVLQGAGKRSIAPRVYTKAFYVVLPLMESFSDIPYYEESVPLMGNNVGAHL